MKNIVLFGVALMLSISVAQAGPTTPDTLYISVLTDKDVYMVGEEVTWSIYARSYSGLTNSSTIQTNFGISFLHMHLDDDTSEILNPAIFGLTDFGPDQGFVFLLTNGSVDSSMPHLRSMTSMQLPNSVSAQINIGNDGNEHLFRQGSYTVTNTGLHTLSAIDPQANFWKDQNTFAVTRFQNIENTAANFVVVPVPAPGAVFLGCIGIACIRLMQKRKLM
ncbi:MAG: hypothetical protein GY869_20730 [Planctomycetes bacterium]|nr:hypothetical protein [Planctomycetota bacterium]